MKRKIKKGPGKARQIPVKDLHHVVTTSHDCAYVSAGKPYLILSQVKGKIAMIISNDGNQMTAPLEGTSAHLDHKGCWYHPFK